jgi:hypothetical protein
MAIAGCHGTGLLGRVPRSVWQPSAIPADRVIGLLLLVAYGFVYLILFFVGLTLLAFWSDRDIDVFRRLSAKFMLFGSWG